jgi:seryl-tRNA synthetase
MLTLKFIQENKDLVIEKLAVKNFDAKTIIEELVQVDNYRKDTQKNLDNTLAELNDFSKKIGFLYKEGRKEEAESAKLKSSELKEESQKLGQKMKDVERHLHELLVKLPNIPHDSVKPGKSDEDNEIVRSFGELQQNLDNALPHWELAKKYDIIDFELGNKITGAGFPVYKGKGARLQRALINFFLDEAENAGFREIIPPILVNEDSGFGTGQLPDKDGQMYHCEVDNLYLIPTAEVPVTNIYRDVILDSKEFPVKNTAYTPCFRREAGSYGKDVRGLNRLHQFDKVEIVSIEHPEKSYAMLDEMVVYVEGLIRKLNLPYRILRLCGGDLSFTSALTYDFEVYSGAQKKMA